MFAIPRLTRATLNGDRRPVARRQVVGGWTGAALAGLAGQAPRPAAADHVPGPGAHLDHFVQAYCAAWSSGHPERLAAMYAPDAVLEEVVSGGVVARGRGEVAAFAASLYAAFPNFAATPRAGFSGGGRAVVEWTLTGEWSDDDDRDDSAWMLVLSPESPPAADILVASVLDLADGAIVADRWYGPPFVT